MEIGEIFSESWKLSGMLGTTSIRPDLEMGEKVEVWWGAIQVQFEDNGRKEENFL